MASRALGYTLLAVGIVLILGAVYLVYASLVGYIQPPKIFSFGDVIVYYGSTQIKVLDGSQLSKIADLSFWALLAAFVASAGENLATWG
ncbi:MAG: hypothetical protein QXP98_01850 [Thermoproteus sp.]